MYSVLNVVGASGVKAKNNYKTTTRVKKLLFNYSNYKKMVF